MDIYLKPIVHKEAIAINESDLIELFIHPPQIDCSNTEDLKKRISEYFGKEKSDCGIPMPEKLCLFLGISTQIFRKWLIENGERGRISRKALNDIIKEINRASRNGRTPKEVRSFFVKNFKMWLKAYKGND